jgi:spore cortex biosynthesis protein YabQ
MIVTLSEQTLTFLCSCVLGVLLSCYFDIFRVVRLICGNRKTVTLVCDLLFFLSATLFTYLFFVRFCSGQIRVYGLIGELLGFLLCHYSVSALFMRLAVLIVRLVRRFLRLLARPWFALFRFFRKKFQKSRAARAEKREKRKKNRENSLQPHRDVVYNLLKLYRKNSKKEDAVREKEGDQKT